MSILKSFIFLIFLLAPYASATEIKQTTYAYWYKPDVEIFYITPKKIDKDTQLLFIDPEDVADSKRKKYLKLLLSN